MKKDDKALVIALDEVFELVFIFGIVMSYKTVISAIYPRKNYTVSVRATEGWQAS